MAIILEAAYSKKLGLPNYSSHSYVVSIRTELSDLTQVEAESARLYALLQQSVDNEIQQVGFLPDATTYGMNGAEASPQQSSRPPSANGDGDHHTDHPIHEQPGDHWVCSDKQKELILKLVEQHGLDKKEVEALAKEMFGLPVKTLNRLQASGLIEELLERHGKARRRTATAGATAPPPTGGTHGHEHARRHLAAAATEDQIIEKLQQKVSASKLALFQSCRLKFLLPLRARTAEAQDGRAPCGRGRSRRACGWNRARWRRQSPVLRRPCTPPTKKCGTAAQAEEPVAWDNPASSTSSKQTGWRLLETFFRESSRSGRQARRRGSHRRSRPGQPRSTHPGRRARSRAGRAHHRLQNHGHRRPTPRGRRLVNATQATAYSLLYRENTGRKEAGIELHHLVKLKQPKLVVIALPPIGEREQSRLCGSSTPTSSAWNGATSSPHRDCSVPPASSSTNARPGTNHHHPITPPRRSTRRGLFIRFDTHQTQPHLHHRPSCAIVLFALSQLS